MLLQIAIVVLVETPVEVLVETKLDTVVDLTVGVHEEIHGVKEIGNEVVTVMIVIVDTRIYPVKIICTMRMNTQIQNSQHNMACQDVRTEDGVLVAIAYSAPLQPRH